MKEKPSNRKVQVSFVLLLITLLTFVALAQAAPAAIEKPPSDAPEAEAATEAIRSHRLIVVLESPAWAEVVASRTPEGRVPNLAAPDAQSYMAQLEAEQQAFVEQMVQTVPTAELAYFTNANGEMVPASYQVLLNAVAVEVDAADVRQAQRALSQVPGVRSVYFDYARDLSLYASLDLINAPALWAQLDGRANAGEGIKIASVDGGLHHEAPMFDGTGYTCPPGYPKGELENTNCKIIVSRVYFRPWDPPAVGDAAPWPGVNGTPHGVHTGSTAGGNIVTDATYLGAELPTLSGVAPAAYMMSYRVFYPSVTGSGSAYDVELVAALEDAVMDGADVINNSWGGGPTSLGGELDAIDNALINAVRAGVFVSMSAGNAGPGLGTGDHPSPDYISVAASTTSGTYAAGRLHVSAPEPISPTLQNMPYGTATFGPPLPIAQVVSYDYVPAADVAPGNVTGCAAFPANTFDGVAALISRGACSFGTKVWNAQQAGAEFVVIYNNQGDDITNMSFACEMPGCTEAGITISSIFVGQTNGENMLAWYDDHGSDSELTIDTEAFQRGNTPDVIANFSSRGPGVPNVLKPDIAAPGVNIMAQGYDPLATGEARHLGYGQVSGTSMAAPHVSGAAALVKQAHPDWGPAEIKSALMSTSKYMDIWTADGRPAQPLDMGAGRLDLTNAADPGVILYPPSIGYGYIVTGTSETLSVRVTSVATATETYALSTLYTGASFTMTTSLPGFSVSPSSITLAPGESATVEVTFDTASGMGIGDNQGYVILDGTTHEAHFPVWARVTPDPDSTGDVLLIDNDGSSSLGRPNYRSYYTDVLDNLGLDYDVWNADIYYNNPTTIPEAAVLATYDVIIYFTGDNYQPDGTFTVSTALTALDMDILTEYANQGGIIIAMGQDASAILEDSTLLGFVFGADPLQDSVTGYDLPELPIVGYAETAPEFRDVVLDLSGRNIATLTLSGANEVPPVATTTGGTARVSYNVEANRLSYNITVRAGDPVTLTNAHVHTGTVSMSGPVLHQTWPFTTSQYVTDTLSWSGSVVLSEAEEEALLAGNTYLNVHSTANPGGEVRAQIILEPSGDGAGNQYYIDELDPPFISPEAYPGTDPTSGYTKLLRYPGSDAELIDEGLVSVAHRAQPSLELPGITYLGRSIYASFGLEGVNNGTDATSREELMMHFLNWAWDEPSVTIQSLAPLYGPDAEMIVFTTTLTSNIPGTEGWLYRWDFGDGTGIHGPYPNNVVGHDFDVCGTYAVRVEVTDTWGNVALGSLEVDVTEQCDYRTYLPIIFRH